MLVWFVETTLVATVLASVALLAGRRFRLEPAARHALWLVVLVKLVAPPVVSWPWAPRLVGPSSEVDFAPGGPGLVSDGPRGTSLRIAPTNALVRTFAGRLPAWRLPIPDLVLIGRWALGVWGAVSATLVLWSLCRIARFRLQFRLAMPAPGWLVDEARRIGGRLGVRAPEILVLPGLTTPMLWFLGRPKLLVPARLTERFGAVAWQGILAHELAHLVRLDHWVRRLELAAGLLWWWNPLYWLTRRRLDIEAELACDEWAVLAFPEGRLAYAEALLEVCRSLSTAEPAVPVLGVAGAGRFLERRVVMILREQDAPRNPAWVLMGAGLLALLALPGWSANAAPGPKPAASAASASALGTSATVAVADDDREEADVANDDDKPADGPKSRGPTREDQMIRAKKRAAEAEARAAARQERASATAADKIAAAKKKVAEAAARREKAVAAKLQKQVAEANLTKKRAAEDEDAGRQERVNAAVAEKLAAAKKRAAEAAAVADKLTEAKKKATEAAVADKITAVKKRAEAAARRGKAVAAKVEKRAAEATPAKKKAAEADAVLGKMKAAREEKSAKGPKGKTASDSSNEPRRVNAQRRRDLQSRIEQLQKQLKALQGEGR
jgi:beta-lactamase regulating signal transducer with metallopeptidase domain